MYHVVSTSVYAAGYSECLARRAISNTDYTVLCCHRGRQNEAVIMLCASYRGCRDLDDGMKGNKSFVPVIPMCCVSPVVVASLHGATYRQANRPTQWSESPPACSYFICGVWPPSATDDVCMVRRPANVFPVDTVLSGPLVRGMAMYIWNAIR